MGSKQMRVPRAARKREDSDTMASTRIGAAVIEMASERDISTASVSELARRAGISRTTFYQHAQSPTDLLTQILLGDLDTVRTDHLEQIKRNPDCLPAIRREGHRHVVEHVLRHESIYGGGHETSSRALRDVLARHVTQSALHLLEMDVLGPRPLPRDVWPLHAAHHGFGFAATIEAWLQMPPPRSVQHLLDVLDYTCPPWLQSPRRSS